ncbi:hypothetical protein ASF88_12325 [Leifsonia sp. Leaf336]|nr:hypothetical protein ASF88_12325 [Leifsonia sp. Leaf336]
MLDPRPSQPKTTTKPAARIRAGTVSRASRRPLIGTVMNTRARAIPSASSVPTMTAKIVACVARLRLVSRASTRAWSWARFAYQSKVKWNGNVP